MRNKQDKLCCLLINIVLSVCMLGFVFCMTSHAATIKSASDKAATDNLRGPAEQKLQQIYDQIYNKLANARTDLTLDYPDEGNNHDTLSIAYRLANRRGCNIEISQNEDTKHTKKCAETDMTKCYLHDTYCNTVRIDMSMVKSINVTRPMISPSVPKIAYYNGDILNNCIYVDFKAIDRGHAFRLKQTRHVQEYVNSERHEDNRYKIDDIPKEISDSLSTYSMCVSDEELAERLVRAFNDYLDVCRDTKPVDSTMEN